MLIRLSAQRVKMRYQEMVGYCLWMEAMKVFPLGNGVVPALRFVGVTSGEAG